MPTYDDDETFWRPESVCPPTQPLFDLSGAELIGEYREVLPVCPTGSPPDRVNPDHYKTGGIETIDYIEAKGLGFHLGNVVKYLSRAGKKTEDSLEDLKKARWYLNRAIANAEAP